MNTLKAVILAAGKGTRMESDLPKVVHKVMEKTLVEYVIEATKEAGAREVCLVIGHGADVVREAVGNEVEYRIQKEQLGTGHAVKCAMDFIGEDGECFVLCGDTPLITGNTLKALAEYHSSEQNAITVLSATVEDPTGYGRIIRNKSGEFVKSVEHKDATDDERDSKEINSGMYLFNAKQLSEALDELTTDNAQGEYYLPDTLTIVKNKGFKVGAFVISNADEIAGVNTKDQLKEAEQVMKQRV